MDVILFCFVLLYMIGAFLAALVILDPAIHTFEPSCILCWKMLATIVFWPFYLFWILIKKGGVIDGR